MTLLELIEADGVKLTRQGKTYRGRCPFHHGKTSTSLLVDGGAGKFFCFGCDQRGDSIDWLRERRGLSFAEACRYLGRDPGPRSNGPRPASTAWEPREAKTPAGVWQERARTFLDGAVSRLWSRRGDTTRAWLHAEKGLSDGTIKVAGLGFNPADLYEPRDTWGLEPSLKNDGTERRQWIPAGLVIPHVIGGAVHRLRIRRGDPGDGPRYIAVSGSSMAPMAWGRDKAAAVIVESELDGLLLNQEAGDLAGVVTMGSAQAKPDRITHETLTATPVILVSLDSDEAGAKASWKFWLETYPNAKRWPTPYGKDPSEAAQKGLNIRTWVEAGLTPGTFTEQSQGSVEAITKPFPKEWLQKYDETILERLAIMTVDGRLSDQEAARILN